MSDFDLTLADLEEMVSDLQRELRGTQEMLAQVLKAVGEEVFVTHKQMQEGFHGESIQVEQDFSRDGFSFRLVKDESSNS